MSEYYRAVAQCDLARPSDALTLAGGETWFTHVEVLSRDKPGHIVAAADIPGHVLKNLTTPRADIAGVPMIRPAIMGILNITPDSFSDGGQHNSAKAALDGAQGMSGAAILDVGGESTRPGAAFVPAAEERARVVPVIEALREAGVSQAISIDTRKAEVAEAALRAGADIVNVVSGFTFDPDLATLCATARVPVCVMHAQGDPATMQDAPHYDNVLLDVYDFLARQIDRLESLGLTRDQIIVDPGIGFGKTQAHNLALLSRLSLFHSLGVPVLLGASRKKFIGTIGGAVQADARMPGSIAVALTALKQGIQIVRVHDVDQTRQAIALWRAVMAGGVHE